MINFHLREKTNTWPGFVDLFSNLVIILIFLLIVFVFLWTTTNVFNKQNGIQTIDELKKSAAEQSIQLEQMQLAEQEIRRKLILAQAEFGETQEKLEQSNLSTIKLAEGYETMVKNQVADMQRQVEEKQQQINELTVQLNQANLAKENTALIEQERKKLQDEMSAQRAELNEQLTKLQSALDAAEEKSRAQEVEYTELSTRLNKALADKVAELKSATQFQSAFYKAIKIALGEDNKSIENDGDRFIVSSDILFPSGSYTLSDEGKNQLRLIANVIKNLEHTIPSDIDWIIRVDGHTDKKPVIRGTRAYWNNTQLSMLRATSVVDELIRDGVSKRRLLPTGFGSMYPVELGNSPADLQKNRRIELQLTNR